MIRFPLTPELQAKLYADINGKKTFSMSSSKNDTVTIYFTAPKICGLTSVKMILNGQLYDFLWTNTSASNETYSILMDRSTMKTADHHIFEILLYCDKKAYYLDKYTKELLNDELSFHITSNAENSEKFIFTLTEGSPSVIKGAIYHIFTDRFNKTTPITREDTLYDPDWECGIPEYTQRAGEHLENNTHFGGSFDGIEEKLDYLEELSVEYIYLSPVSKAHSNHKYDVGDYFTVDECLGGEEKLKSLIKSCHTRGIKVIFDSVFNHTGDDSKYFNKFSRYDSIGAYQSSSSSYYNWYTFGKSRDEYDCWWGVKCLPSIKKGCREFIDFICCEGGVIDYYMNTLDADGLRLDVADELTLEFIKCISSAVKRNKPNGIVIGEVWENASRKIAYDEKKFYFDKGKLDSVTNYPLMNAILDFVKNGNTNIIKNTISEIYCDYPTKNAHILFNILSTHDTWRALTRIGANEPSNKNEKAIYKMKDTEYNEAVKKMKLAVVLQAFLPGVPCVYYGDEIGMQGFEDPFCRMPMKWNEISEDLLKWYKRVLRIRKNNRPLYEGGLKLKYCDNGIIIFDRSIDKRNIRIMINATNVDFEISFIGFDLITGKQKKREILKSFEALALILE